MNKKILSSILAGVMTVSTLSIAASADVSDLSESKQTYTVNAGMQQATITATVPTEINAFINPYKAIITDSTAAGSSFASGIASPTYQIINGMEEKLAVTVTPSIASSKTVSISEKPLKANLTEKTVFAYLNTTTLEANNKALFRNTHYDANDKTQVIFKEEGVATANIMILDKSATKGTEGGKGYFRVEGDCTEKPEDAWTDSDTVSLSLILDLAPSAGEVKDASLAKLEVKGGAAQNSAAAIKFAEPTAFDPAVTSYTIKADTTAANLKWLGISCELKDTTTPENEVNVYVFYNGKKLGTDPTVDAGNKVGLTQVNEDGDYKVGDVIEIIVANGIYTQSYKITVVE